MITIEGLENFEKALQDFEKQTIQAHADQIQAIVRGIHERVTSHHAQGGTPVLSGYMLANWQVTVGAPATDQVAFVPPTNPGTAGYDEDTNRRAAKAVTDADLERVDFSNPFQVFWITNNAPYSVDVEYGTYSPPVRASDILRGAVREVLTGDRRSR